MDDDYPPDDVFVPCEGGCGTRVYCPDSDRQLCSACRVKDHAPDCACILCYLQSVRHRAQVRGSAPSAVRGSQSDV